MNPLRTLTPQCTRPAFVHLSNGPFVADGGWELVVVLGLFSLVLAAVGAGRFSLDSALTRTTRRATVPA
ncbi:hypothetical protein F1D05_05160 [Kribbella qitaiheensis]|uniref:Uncharacterized protein n=1 Tax=Kribbella qitaiheensis TaxID=1544730 RepID=A0A7G6WTV7_9ACTN|nr:hypothetical protein [Kribbella qitaiheensis]QNE17422.1 hypothetical protein F1D05_05160 [Kribbella qitaiheensis]